MSTIYGTHGWIRLDILLVSGELNAGCIYWIAKLSGIGFSRHIQNRMMESVMWRYEMGFFSLLILHERVR
jgi:aromatic ring hydroxylase